MRTLHTRSGVALTEQQQRALIAGPHRADWHAEYRGELHTDGWVRLEMAECQIQASQAGQPWTLDIATWSESVLRDDGDGRRILYPQPDVTPWGGWIRVWAEIMTPGQWMDDPAVCPLGVYRVESVTSSGGSLRIQGRDMLAQLECDRIVPLSQQRVAPGSSRSQMISALVSAAWPAGTDPPGLLQIDGLPSGTTPASGASTDQYDLERQDLIQALLGSSQRVLVAALDTTSSMYRCVSLPRPLTNPSPVGGLSAVSRDRPALQSLSVTRERSGVINRAAVQWTLKTANASRPRRTTVDLVGSLDATTPVQLGRRFGTQSDYWDGSGIHSEQVAVARCEDLIESRLLEATDYEIECAPYWGLEIGDCIQIEDWQGDVSRAWVRSWSMSSTGQAWRMSAQPANLLDSNLGRGNSTTATREIAELVEYNEWRPINSAHVDETCRSLQGWHKSGCTLSDKGKTAMSAKATATTFKIWTDSAYSTRWNKAQAKIALGKQPDKVKVRVWVGSTPGPWRTIEAGKSGTIRSGDIVVSGNFGITLEVADATIGHIYWIDELTVEVPK